MGGAHGLHACLVRQGASLLTFWLSGTLSLSVPLSISVDLDVVGLGHVGGEAVTLRQLDDRRLLLQRLQLFVLLENLLQAARLLLAAPNWRRRQLMVVVGGGGGGGLGDLPRRRRLLALLAPLAARGP